MLSHDRQHVLLNLHRKAGRWFHFGGHLEPDDVTLAGAALREATEESGLARAASCDAEPLHLSRHAVEFCDPRGTVDHLDVRFLARPEPTSSRWSARSPSTCAGGRWTSCPPTEPDMVEMIGLALNR